MAASNIRVHLVHGTWAKGILGKSKAWTEAGHGVYERLRALLPKSVAMETFLWSGANSVSDREKAARLLQVHLEESLRKFPDDRHVVVAHSHGGKISNLAVADPRFDGRIRSLICLATPFTYVVKASLRRIQTGILGITSVGYAMYWTGVLLLFLWIPGFVGVTAFAGIVAVKSFIAFLGVAIIAKGTHERSPHSIPAGPRKSKVFLLRGSRDEATLVLSTAQVVNWAFYAFAKFNDVTMPTVRKPVTWFAYAAVYAACLLAGVAMALPIHKAILTGAPAEVVFPLALLVYAPAAAGFVFLVGCPALAGATGFWGVRSWMVSAVEVETAPPNTACQMYVFSQVESTSLRHGLYEDEAVLKMVADLVQT
jgi:hypothetical protein